MAGRRVRRTPRRSPLEPSQNGLIIIVCFLASRVPEEPRSRRSGRRRPRSSRWGCRLASTAGGAPTCTSPQELARKPDKVQVRFKLSWHHLLLPTSLGMSLQFSLGTWLHTCLATCSHTSLGTCLHSWRGTCIIPPIRAGHSGHVTRLRQSPPTWLHSWRGTWLGTSRHSWRATCSHSCRGIWRHSCRSTLLHSTRGTSLQHHTKSVMSVVLTNCDME